MQTMNPVLQVGAYDWNPDVLPAAEFQSRLLRLRERMLAGGWSGAAVFGDRPDHGNLAYLTNFTPRLSGALALIPAEGEVRILSFDGGRMIPAGKETTWVDDVRPAKDLAAAAHEWINELGGGARIAAIDFGVMPKGIFDVLATVPGFADAVDITEFLLNLRRRKSPAEVAAIRGAAALLKQAEAKIHACREEGASFTASVLSAETAARRAGAQDIRSLYSPDGGRTFIPVERPADAAEGPLAAYLAVRNRGYWVDGFITAGAAGAPAGEAAERALQAMMDTARDGASISDLRAARNSRLGNLRAHDIVGDGCGSGLGLSLGEHPDLTNGPDLPLRSGDVCSLKVGVADDQAGAAVISALVRITGDGREVLWQSLDRESRAAAGGGQ